MIEIFAVAGVPMCNVYMSIICIVRLNTHVAADDKVRQNKLIVFTYRSVLSIRINRRIKKWVNNFSLRIKYKCIIIFIFIFSVMHFILLNIDAQKGQ